MKLITCLTPSHQVFLPHFNTIFRVDQNINLYSEEFEQECPTGAFADAGWNDTTRRKFEHIGTILQECDEGELLAFADADIQFFRPISDLAGIALKDNDIVFQNDYYGHACTGFFYMRNNRSIRDLVQMVYNEIPNWRDDQEAMNKILPTWSGEYGLLPNQFFTFGSFYQHWDETKTDFPLPRGMVLHHANWVKGIENKLKLLTLVREIYDRNS